MADPDVDDNSKEDPKSKRIRGRRVGVRQMENVFMPQMSSTFGTLKSILEKRLLAKRTEIREMVCESLGLHEIIEAGAKIGKLAKEKYKEANRLEEEAEELEKAAKDLVDASKIISLTLEEEARSYYRSGHTKQIKDMTISFTDDFKQIVDAAMLIQKEHLDFEWLKHQLEDFTSRLRMSVTMEQAVGTLEDAQGLVKQLESEHKQLLAKQEIKNAGIDRICAKWEESDSG